VQARALRFALHQDQAPAGLRSRPPRDRHFKEALTKPYWTAIRADLATRLWRALGRRGAHPSWLSSCRVARNTHPVCNFRCPYSLADAGTPEEASAWRWLRVHGAAVRSIGNLTVIDKDVERLSTLQLAMPLLDKVMGLKLQARPGAAPAATRAFLVAAARAVARCPCLQDLELLVELAPTVGEQLPDTFGQELAEACTLMEVSLSITSRAGKERDWPRAASVSHLVMGLAGLSRLRALSLTVDTACMESALPACVSCLAQLTVLSLSGFSGLRCAPGWARLPALVHLEFKKCEFLADGEAALPGMDTLVSLKSLTLEECPSLRTWPMSLWRLEQLSSLVHEAGYDAWELARLPRDALPAAGLPASALCFPVVTWLTLVGHNLSVFPQSVLGMTRLVHLDLAFCCFEDLPEGVCMLTALDHLSLGRHTAKPDEVGGALDVRALGSLAGLPNLVHLGFFNCSVLFCGSFQAAAAHPRLENVYFDTSYPASGPSCRACLGFAFDLLQQGRPGVLEVSGSVEGAGKQDSSRFRVALQVAGFPLQEGAA
jgi:hypothetical protein